MPTSPTPVQPPYYPVIYVRGYAFSQTEIEATTDDPYMGFNLGATKLKQETYDKVRRHVFEGPLVRLMKDYGYRDIYAEGQETTGQLPERCVVIYRYYEALDSDLGQATFQTLAVGDVGGAIVMESRAKGLAKLIRDLRDRICLGDASVERQFRVNLVAHSLPAKIDETLSSPVISVQGGEVSGR